MRKELQEKFEKISSLSLDVTKCPSCGEYPGEDKWLMDEEVRLGDGLYKYAKPVIYLHLECPECHHVLIYNITKEKHRR